MRQLAAEGFMHNRARMITASFLTRTLGIDWRHGYRHFRELLADGDVACNAGNWQWVAGTGSNPRRGRVLNPLRQAARFDREGDYVRRYVPELASLTAPTSTPRGRCPPRIAVSSNTRSRSLAQVREYEVMGMEPGSGTGIPGAAGGKGEGDGLPRASNPSTSPAQGRL
jgi:hypothetical protein